MQELYRHIYAKPEFHELEKKRGIFSWTLAILIMLFYFIFILIIAFVPEIFAIPITSSSITTWGIPVGIAVILFSFLLTGIYVRKANTQFDEITRKIIEQAHEEHNQ